MCHILGILKWSKLQIQEFLKSISNKHLYILKSNRKVELIFKCTLLLLDKTDSSIKRIIYFIWLHKMEFLNLNIYTILNYHQADNIVYTKDICYFSHQIECNKYRLSKYIFLQNLDSRDFNKFSTFTKQGFQFLSNSLLLPEKLMNYLHMYLPHLSLQFQSSKYIWCRFLQFN